MTDGEGSAGDVDDQEVTDECAMLIHTDHMHKHTHIKGGQDKTSGITNYIVNVEYKFLLIMTEYLKKILELNY